MLRKNILSLLSVLALVAATPVFAGHKHSHHAGKGKTAQTANGQGKRCHGKNHGKGHGRKANKAAGNTTQNGVKKPACVNGQCRR